MVGLSESVKVAHSVGGQRTEEKHQVVGHFHIPGEAAKRDYAVYVMVATRRDSKAQVIYVGKTGDNNDGCNPIISRAGNHLSFNKLHSQTRNHLGSPEEYDFDFFYTTFGGYVPKAESRDGLTVINVMERELNLLAQKAFPNLLLNPVSQTSWGARARREARAQLVTPERIAKLKELIERVRVFMRAAPSRNSSADLAGPPDADGPA
jgi:hypothetical protein